MGQKYASYNSQGIVNGFYDSIDSPPPATATVIPITDAEWQAAISSKYQPVTVVNGALTIPSGPTLAQAKTSQIALLQSAYKTAINAPVTFKNAAGVTSSYPSGKTILVTGDTAEGLLAKIIAAGSSSWTLGKWLDTNNVAQTFTFADLQGLAAAMEAAITLDWTDLIAKIDEVNNATTVSEVQAIVW